MSPNISKTPGNRNRGANAGHPPPLLSVCIVNYNTAHLLQNCLHSLPVDRDGASIKLEITVVDNHSRDGSAQMVKTGFPNVRWIANPGNAGYAHALNQAIQSSAGDFFLVLNTDTVIHPGTLEKTVCFMLDHDEAGIVGCKILNPDHSLQRSCRSYPGLSVFFYENAFLDKLFPKSRIFGKPYLSYFNYDRVAAVDVVLGAFMMIRREVIDHIGGFDERFFMYSEETDFCYRTMKAGWRIVFYPGASIVHFGGESTKQESVKMFIELHKSHHRFIAKYHGTFYLIAVKLVLFLGLCIRFTGQLIKLALFLPRPGSGASTLRALRRYG
jgi:GT2 family glycosyltransferase